jgi:predicted TIM-barrel fold metal-dependent hydrolase
MKKDIWLSQYDPVIEAVVEEHIVKKPKFPVIDFHTHMGKLLLGEDYAGKYDTAVFMERMNALGVVKLCNMDGFWGEDLTRMMQKTAGFEESIFNFIWIDTGSLEAPDFEKRTRDHIAESVKRGARGIKMWKDISLTMKDRNGVYLRTDDGRFDVVYDAAARCGIPVLMHIADPVAFFKPLDASNERFEQLVRHPEWHFFGEGRYTFEELMDMQDATIEKHPDTTFVIAHFGSYPENLKHVAQRLDRYPNMFIDMAARVAELGRVPYSARDFFIRYKERILFSTDCTPLEMEEHMIMYRFLETADECFHHAVGECRYDSGRWPIYGIHLPDDVLEHVYYENAARLLGITN